MLELFYLKLFLISTVLSVVGVFLAYLYGRNTTEFRWSEYILFVAPPSILVAINAWIVDYKILLLYAICAVVGFSLEWLLGFTYYKTLNKKLWVYDKDTYPAKGNYTSYLTFPMWGTGGVAFWMLGKIIGL